MAKRAERVPVILQMEASECGAASLAMVLAYYKKYVPLEKLRVDCGVSRDGSNAANIYRAARHHQLTVKAYKKEPEDLRELPLPAILHWGFNHFVVLAEFKGQNAVLNDPAVGRRLVSAEELDKSFTGVVLCFEKDEGFQAGGEKRSVAGFIKKRLGDNKAAFVYLALLGLLLAMINMVTPAFSRLYIDKVLLAGDALWLTKIITAMCGALIVLAAVLFLESKYRLKLKAKLSMVSDSSFFWHILSLPVEFFSQRYTGDLINRQASNEIAAELLCQKLAPLFINALMAVFYLTVLIHYDALLALLAVAVSAGNILLLYYIGRNQADAAGNVTRSQGLFVGAVAAGVEMIETVKAVGCEDGVFERWAGYGAKYINAGREVERREIYLEQIPVFLMQAVNALILFIGAFKILNGEFTVGMLIAFQGFLVIFLTPMNELVDNIGSFQRLGDHMARIDDVLRYEPEHDLLDMQNKSGLRELSGHIQLDNIHFAYSPLQEKLIEDFSLSIKPGQSIALVGGTGSGKSTLAKLIAGLYQPNQGSITFDGHPRQAISREMFYRSLAMVDQDVILFQASILDNITLWDADIPYADVLKACKDACLHDDIMARPQGYATLVAQGGKNLSGGQKQRLEIARALVKSPRILILDEATSALDAETEYQVMEALSRRNITCIIVAHRLSTIRDCHQIIVLEQGKIRERGTHQQLKAAGGLYARLVEN